MLLTLLGSPVTLLPVVGGVTTALAGWVLGWDLAVIAFAGVAGLAAGAGTFLTRLFTRTDSATKDALQALERETEAERKRVLDGLHQRLSEDGDPRTQSLLGDLRTLAQSFRDNEEWFRELNASTTLDVMHGVDQLFQQGVRHLEQTLKLQSLAQKVTVPEARSPIVARREALIEEVRTSLAHLSQVLTTLQQLSAARVGNPGALARLQEELEHGLEVARRVETRLEALERDTLGEMDA